MKRLALMVAVLSFAGSVFAQEPVPAPKPTPNAAFRAQFTAALPEGAPDTSAWAAFREFAKESNFTDPARGGVLGNQAVRLGFCKAEEPCAFLFSVLLLQNKPSGASNLVVRYLLKKADGTRAEGYADADLTTQTYRYFWRKGDAWSALGGPESALEGQFIGATWEYVVSQ